MSSTPPQDAPASDAPSTPNDPWDLRNILSTLPPALQQLLTQPLTDIMSTCHSACSDSVESANAVTRDIERLLQRLVAAVDTELQSNSHSDIRTSSESWHLLGRLVDGINRHFQIRPRILFVSRDADMQSAATAARGIKACFTRLIELLSSDEDRAANVAAFTIYLMDTDGDAETAMRFAFLDIISRRVVAVKRPSQRWHVTIDEEEVRHNCSRDDAESSGFDDVPTPFRKDNFQELECPVCGDPLFAKQGDGSVVLLARQLKCPTVVDVTDRTPTGHRFPHVTCDGCAQKQFIEHKQTSCPHCRHNFQEHLCVDIAAALHHQVHEDRRVLWTAAPQRRLAALNVLVQLPAETPLGGSISPGVLQSCFDAEVSIAAAALRCGRLSYAVEAVPVAEAITWLKKLICLLKSSHTDNERENLSFAARDICSFHGGIAAFMIFDGDLAALTAALVHALNVAERDVTIDNIALAISHLAQDAENCAALIGAGACAALVEALKVAEADDTRGHIASAISVLALEALKEEGRAALIAAGACAALVEALKVAQSWNTHARICIYRVLRAISYLAQSEEGRVSLIGICAALVAALKGAETDDSRGEIAKVISFLASEECGRVALIAAGACAALVEALKVAESDDDTRNNIVLAISHVAQIEENRVALIVALVEALNAADRDVTRNNIVCAISHLAQRKECRVALIAAGACAALVEALNAAESDDDTRSNIDFAISFLARCEEGRVALAHTPGGSIQ